MAGLWTPPILTDLSRERINYFYNSRLSSPAIDAPHVATIAISEEKNKERTNEVSDDNGRKKSFLLPPPSYVPLPPRKSLFSGSTREVLKEQAANPKQRTLVAVSKNASSRSLFRRLPSARRSRLDLDKFDDSNSDETELEIESEEKEKAFKGRLAAHRMSVQLTKEFLTSQCYLEYKSDRSQNQRQDSGEIYLGDDRVETSSNSAIPAKYTDVVFLRDQLLSVASVSRDKSRKQRTRNESMFLGPAFVGIKEKLVKAAKAIVEEKDQKKLEGEEEEEDDDDLLVSLEGRGLNDLNFRQKLYQSFERTKEIVTEVRLRSNRLCFSYPGLLTYSCLRTIDLSHNHISDTGACNLFRELHKFQRIENVDLSYNRIQSSNFVRLVALCKSLKTLDLSWNVLDTSGIAHFSLVFSQKDCQLQSLNLARNKNHLASTPAEVSKEAHEMSSFSKSLGFNRSLAHLDISHNLFAMETMEILAEDLTNNHTLLGFHVVGNMARLDARGFVIPLDFVDTEGNFCSNCWVCGDWQPVMFKLRLEKEPQENGESQAGVVPDRKKKVRVHLPQLNWEGFPMVKKGIVDVLSSNAAGDVYETTLTLPVHAEAIYYFYSVDGTPCLSNSELQEPVRAVLISDDRSQVIDPSNNLQNVLQYELNDYYRCNSPKGFSIPRLSVQDLEERIQNGQFSPWKLGNSCWRSRVIGQTYYLTKAAPSLFEKEWPLACENIDCNTPEVANVARPHYYRIVELFANYVGRTSEKNDDDALLQKLSLAGLILLISECFNLDFSRGKHNDELLLVGKIFGEVVTETDSTTTGLYRYQFLQFLVRFGMELNEDLLDYVRVEKLLNRLNTDGVVFRDDFRRSTLYRNKVDAFFRERYQWFQSLFERCVGEGGVVMSIREFVKFLDLTGAFRFDLVSYQRIFRVFLLSCDGSFNLDIPAFMESFARLAIEHLPDLQAFRRSAECDTETDTDGSSFAASNGEEGSDVVDVVEEVEPEDLSTELAKLVAYHEFTDWYLGEMRLLEEEEDFWCGLVGKPLNIKQAVWNAILCKSDLFELQTDKKVAIVRKIVEQTCNNLKRKLETGLLSKRELKFMEEEVSRKLEVFKARMTKQRKMEEMVLLAALGVINYC